MHGLFAISCFLKTFLCCSQVKLCDNWMALPSKVLTGCVSDDEEDDEEEEEEDEEEDEEEEDDDDDE